MKDRKVTAPKGRFVDDYLLYLMAAASEAASSQFHDHVISKGVRVPEWRVLACLHDWEGGAMVTHLAEYAMIEQSRLTKIIIQMEKRNLVTRSNDPLDRRRVWVNLSPYGKKLANQLVADAKAHEQCLISTLQGSGGERVKTALRALIDRLDETDHSDVSVEQLPNREEVNS